MTRSQTRLRAKRGKRGQLLRELDRLEAMNAVRESSGFLGAVVLVPEGDPDGVLLEQSWASVEHYERWRATTGPVELLRGLRRLLADEPEVGVYQVVDTLG